MQKYEAPPHGTIKHEGSRERREAERTRWVTPVSPSLPYPPLPFPFSLFLSLSLREPREWSERAKLKASVPQSASRLKWKYEGSVGAARRLSEAAVW